MRIETIVVSPWQANCYLIAPNDGSGCVIVDPGVTGSELISAALDRLGWQPQAIVCTHGHLDHVGSAATLAAVWDIPVYCAQADHAMLLRPSVGLGAAMAPLIEQVLGSDSLPRPADLRDLSAFEAVGLSFQPYPAPGHTQGSTLVQVTDGVERVVCSGDVLFAGTIGRTDLPGGNGAQMRASLARITEWFADDVVILPGHGPATTLGEEKARNPYLSASFLKD